MDRRRAQSEQPAASSPKAKQDVTAFLQMRCMQVVLEVGWFSTTCTVSDQEAAPMLNSVRASRKGVSITKRLFSAKHPAVAAANAARARLRSYVESMTIPVAAIMPARAEDPKAFLMKQPSTRLILRDDIDEFDARVEQLTAELRAAALALDAAVDEVKEIDRANLGALFDESHYAVRPSEQISVRGPLLTEVGYRADFSEIAPKACERAMRQLRQQLEGTVALAASEFHAGLTEAVEQIALQLANRTRLRPLTAHARYAELYDAEVVNEARHSEDAEVPSGYVRLQVRRKQSRGKSDAVWLDPMTEAEYAALRPTETDERRKVYDTTVDSLIERMQMFHRVREMLGEDGEAMKATIDRLSDLLTYRGNALGTDQLVDHMRNRPSFRDTLRAGLQTVAQQLREASPLLEQQQRRRLIARREE